jgi:hypothetical protein
MSTRSSFVVTVDTKDRNIHQQGCENLKSQKIEVMCTILDLVTLSNT